MNCSALSCSKFKDLVGAKVENTIFNQKCQTMLFLLVTSNLMLLSRWLFGEYVSFDHGMSLALLLRIKFVGLNSFMNILCKIGKYINCAQEKLNETIGEEIKLVCFRRDLNCSCKHTSYVNI